MKEILITITPNLKTAADAYAQAGQFSRENPETPLRGNPFFRPATRAHRAATGDVNLGWTCDGCRAYLPLINDAMKTACCERPEVLLQVRVVDTLVLDLVRYEDETTEQAAQDLIGDLPVAFEVLGVGSAGGWDEVRFTGSRGSIATLSAQYGLVA